MSPVTISWSTHVDYCAGEAVREATDAIVIDYTGDPDTDEELRAVEDALSSCPVDSASDALEHFRRAAQESTVAEQALYEAIDLLEAHPRSCSCTVHAWESFRGEFIHELGDLPATTWLVDDMTSSEPMRDYVGAPLVDALLDGLLFTSAEVYPRRVPDGVESVELTWTGDLLQVDVVVERKHRKVYFEPLDGPHGRIAALLSFEKRPVPDPSPAHQVTTYDSEVVTVADNLTARGETLPSDVFGETAPTAALLDHLTELRTSRSPEVWRTLVAISENWSGTYADLITASDAVLVASH